MELISKTAVEKTNLAIRVEQGRNSNRGIAKYDTFQRAHGSFFFHYEAKFTKPW